MRDKHKAQGAVSGFEVTGWVDTVGGFVARHPSLWRKLGNFETRIVEASLPTLEADRPVYVAGLARSGSTVLLELLAAHPDTASHRYRDYPMLFTPYLWNRWLDRLPRRREEPAERTHQDGIKVTSESPEAFEEVLWMAFFPQAHDPTGTSVLDRHDAHPEFEAFYRDHLRKLLAVRGGTRYVAKGNYNVTRMDYLLKLFPQARFVVPVRDPVWHIASLMKQHALFVKGQADNPAARRHLARVGHYEFGLDRRPIHTGDDTAIREVIELWRRGEEVHGWARYWALIHGFLADQLESDAELAEATFVVRYEDLCAAPDRVFANLLDHCELSRSEALLKTARDRLHVPDYYEPGFSDEELALIGRLTDPVAARFGYEPVVGRCKAGAHSG
ncbi:MAG: sulfotransferase [Zoogloeaceae bacterium]|nr:sulfotransferase [Zoogloeaceae bacterium]